MWFEAPSLQLNTFDPFEELRDIHPPDAISWWPPAPGWWFLMVLVVFVMIVGLLRMRRYWRSPSRAGARELVRIKREFRATGDDDALAAALSVLLRRCVLAAFPRRDVAGLTGDAWLEFLDHTGATGAFSNGPGRVLISAPYQASSAIEAESLLVTVETWVRYALTTQRHES